MKILVTGANGYVGTGVVKQLIEDGHEVIATDFLTNYIDERAKAVATDLFSVDDPFEFYGRPDAVVHLAWRDGFMHSSDAHLIDLPKHYNFLRKLVEGGIPKVAVMGSMHEIGFFEGAINENTPANPQSLYGISKNALRNAVMLLAQNGNTVFQWLRGFYIVGNTTAGCSVFSKITQAEKEGKEKFPFTTGTNQYDFIDYEEFCEQIAAVVEQEAINGIINCCSGYPMKLKDRVEEFIRQNGYKITLEYGAFPDRPYDSKAVWGDNSKITKIMEMRKA